MIVLEIVVFVSLMFVLFKVTPTEGGKFTGKVEIADKRFAFLSGFSALLGAFLLFSGMVVLGSAMVMGGLLYTVAILSYNPYKEEESEEDVLGV